MRTILKALANLSLIWIAFYEDGFITAEVGVIPAATGYEWRISEVNGLITPEQWTSTSEVIGLNQPGCPTCTQHLGAFAGHEVTVAVRPLLSSGPGAWGGESYPFVYKHHVADLDFDNCVGQPDYLILGQHWGECP